MELRAARLRVACRKLRASEREAIQDHALGRGYRGKDRSWGEKAVVVE